MPPAMACRHQLSMMPWDTLCARAVEAIERTGGEIQIEPSEPRLADDRPYAEYRITDPEGNRLDLSQSKGWEVGINQWERIP